MPSSSTGPLVGGGEPRSPAAPPGDTFPLGKAQQTRELPAATLEAGWRAVRVGNSVATALASFNNAVHAREQPCERSQCAKDASGKDPYWRCIRRFTGGRAPGGSGSGAFSRISELMQQQTAHA